MATDTAVVTPIRMSFIIYNGNERPTKKQRFEFGVKVTADEDFSSVLIAWRRGLVVRRMCNPEHRHVQSSAVFKRLPAKLQEWPKRKMFQIDTQEFGSPEGPLTIFVFVILTRELLHNAKTTSQCQNYFIMPKVRHNP